MAVGLHFAFTETSLHPIGELDLATVSEFEAVLLRFVGARQAVVALDLSGLSFVDASGLAAIVALERQLHDEERVLVLRHPSPATKRVLDTTGLTWMLEVRSGAPLQIEGIAPRDEFGTEASRYLVGEDRRCN